LELVVARTIKLGQEGEKKLSFRTFASHVIVRLCSASASGKFALRPRAETWHCSFPLANGMQARHMPSRLIA
jgi:hypothetical protein